MDPVSQAAIGAAFPQAVNQAVTRSTNQGEAFKGKVVTITWVGCLTGMAPDLDVFIRSSTDPLLFLEYHRHFTHSLFFIPFGALLCTLVFSRFTKPKLSFLETYIVCLLAYSTHALLDSCTTYGTQLLWPFSDQRFAWNTIAVVDPAATIPLVAMVIVTMKRGNPLFARIGLVWFLGYLSLGWWQNQRAFEIASELAEQRGHSEALISIKPGFANVLLWKSVYLHEDTFYVDAIRVGANPMVYSGTSIAKLNIERDLPWLEEGSQQALDVERFRWFSVDYLALDPDREDFVIDMRYSILPNEIKSLWGIGLDQNAQRSQHVTFESDRDTSPDRMAKFWAMLRGDACIPPLVNQHSQQPIEPQICALRL